MAKRNKKSAPAPVVNDAPQAPSADMAIQPMSDGDNGDNGDDARLDAPTVADTAPATVSADAPKASRLRQTTIDAAKLAAQGNIPAPPDFTKPTHAGYRKRLDALVVAVNAGDIGPLLADKTQPVSSSRIMLCRYRDNALAALLARKAAADLAAQDAPAPDGDATQAA